MSIFYILKEIPNLNKGYHSFIHPSTYISENRPRSAVKHQIFKARKLYRGRKWRPKFPRQHLKRFTVMPRTWSIVVAIVRPEGERIGDWSELGWWPRHRVGQTRHRKTVEPDKESCLPEKQGDSCTGWTRPNRSKWLEQEAYMAETLLLIRFYCY